MFWSISTVIIKERQYNILGTGQHSKCTSSRQDQKDLHLQKVTYFFIERGKCAQ